MLCLDRPALAIGYALPMQQRLDRTDVPKEYQGGVPAIWRRSCLMVTRCATWCALSLRFCDFLSTVCCDPQFSRWRTVVTQCHRFGRDSLVRAGLFVVRGTSGRHLGSKVVNVTALSRVTVGAPTGDQALFWLCTDALHLLSLPSITLATFSGRSPMERRAQAWR